MPDRPTPTPPEPHTGAQPSAAPCSHPPCHDDDLCARHEEEQAHAEGEHAFCGPTCEVEFPTDMLRNSMLAWAPPGGKGILAELERRAACQQPADRAADRDRIRRAICEANGFDWDPDWLEPDEYGDHADAVLAVLPDHTTEVRAAALNEAADRLDLHALLASPAARDVINADAAELRRMATEPQPTSARPDDTHTEAGPVEPATPRCTLCNHPKRDHSDRPDHTPSTVVPRRPWCHACNTTCDYAEPGARPDDTGT